MLRLELQLFWLAVQFLTRLPVPSDLPYSDDLSVRSAKYYPLVGALVGLIGAGVLGLAALGLPMAVAALLSLAVTMLLTGAMHEDGLADTADGLLGAHDPDRAMEIMRDSRIGVFGALALMVGLALKAVALASLPLGAAMALLVAAHTVGRMACIQIIARLPYARSSTSKFAQPKVTPDGYRVALATVLIMLAVSLVWITPGAVFAAASLAFVTTLWLRSVLRRRLGGYTGDGLGAAEQLAEVAVLIGGLWWLSI